MTAHNAPVHPDIKFVCGQDSQTRGSWKLMLEPDEHGYGWRIDGEQLYHPVSLSPLPIKAIWAFAPGIYRYVGHTDCGTKQVRMFIHRSIKP